MNTGAEVSRREHIVSGNGVSCVCFPLLEELGFVRHGFVLRTGGVSRGWYESMNLSFTRGDKKEDVEENFRRVASFFGTVPERMVSVYQTHTSEVRRVSGAEAGAGVTGERLYPDMDGLLTDEPGLMLTTSHADCTPLFFADPVRRAVAMTHSGWKGTAGQIALHTVEEMKQSFGTRPEELYAAIGPCICGSCYEVGPEVAEIFTKRYGEQTAFADVCGIGPMLRRKENGKFLLDQKSINLQALLDAGLSREHIAVSSYCTYERDDLFFSRRKMGEKRGNLRAFIGIFGDEE